MRKRTVFWRAAAALLVFALLLPAFGSAMATVHPRPKDEGDEPAYDMMGYVYDKWILFDSNDPSNWIYYVDPDTYSFCNPFVTGNVVSGSVNIDGTIYVSTSDMNGLYEATASHLFMFDENMVPTDLGLFSAPKENIPNEYWNSFLTVNSMYYDETEGNVYAVAAYCYCGPDNQADWWDSIWGIAQIDIETREVEFLCKWTYMGDEDWIGYFWPISVAYERETGSLLVIEGWSNSVVRLNPDAPMEYETVCYLPHYASMMAMGMIEGFEPVPMYIDHDANTLLVSTYIGSDCICWLSKIDLSTGEVIYDYSTNLGDDAITPDAYGTWKCLMEYNPGNLITLGDADGNGDVTVTDALLVMRYAMGIIGELANMEAADVNNSGDVDVTDALLIMRIVMGV